MTYIADLVTITKKPKLFLFVCAAEVFDTGNTSMKDYVFGYQVAADAFNAAEDFEKRINKQVAVGWIVKSSTCKAVFVDDATIAQVVNQ